jgi:hypothetical protein
MLSSVEKDFRIEEAETVSEKKPTGLECPVPG